MNIRTCTLALLAVSSIWMAGCTEKEQVLKGSAVNDAAPYTGTAQTAFTQGGWTKGDKTSWQSELKARQENSQNEYKRMSAKSN